MKCQNCGAELETKQGLKFCPYCGHEVNMEQRMPETIPGAVYGIAKGIIDEVGKQLQYQREHAEEIEERKKQRERENLKQGLWILIVSVILIGGIIAFCMYMAAKEKGVA